MALGNGGFGAGLASGLESGARLGMGLAAQQNEQARQQQQDAQRQQEVAFNQNLQTEDQDMRKQQFGAQVDAEHRKAADDAIKFHQDQIARLGNEGAQLSQQYGGKIPDDQVGNVRDLTAQMKTHEQAIANITDDLYGPTLKADTDQANRTISNLQAGNIQVNQIPPPQLQKTIEIAAGRPVTDYLPNGNQPGKVPQAVTDVETGIKTGNNQMIADGATTIMQPELQKVVGRISADGTPITDVKIHGFMPDPKDQQKLYPVLSVTTAKGGTYLAPVTEGRTTGDPSDPAHADHKTISLHMDDLMSRLEHERALGKLIQQPEIAQPLQQSLEDPSTSKYMDEFRGALYRAGFKSSDLKPPVKYQKFGGVSKAIGLDGRPDGSAPDIADAPDPDKPGEAAVRASQAASNYANANAANARAANAGKGSGLFVVDDKTGQETPYEDGDAVPAGSHIIKVGTKTGAATGDDKVIMVEQPADPKHPGVPWDPRR
jgi:hypothetical protein